MIRITGYGVIAEKPRVGKLGQIFPCTLYCRKNYTLDRKMDGTFYDGRDELYHHAKFGEDRTTRAGCRCENVVFLPAGCREAANCRYCFYSQAKNQVFRPAGATRWPDSGQTLQYRRPPGFAWLGKISRQSVQTGGNASPRISKISTFW